MYLYYVMTVAKYTKYPNGLNCTPHPMIFNACLYFTNIFSYIWPNLHPTPSIKCLGVWKLLRL